MSTGAILSTVVGGLILAGILYLIRLYWPDSGVRRRLLDRQTQREGERLLGALREMARENPADDLDAVLLVEDGARRANVKDPSRAVHLLIDRDLIAAHSAQPTPVYIRLTRAGLDA